MSQSKIVPHKSGPTLMVVGETYILLVTGRETNGRYAIFESLCVPGGGPPPHVHTREDENFYVLEGPVEFMVEGKTITAATGTTVHVPRGTLHTYKGVGANGRMLVQVMPAGLEAFFEEVGEKPGTPVTDAHMQKVMAAAPKYGIEIKLP